MMADNLEKFTDRARNVFVRAQEEARRLRSGYVGSDHLLMALLVEEEDGVAARALSVLGTSAKDICSMIELKVGWNQDSPDDQIGLSLSARHAIRLALVEARRLGHSQVAPEHLLVGILRDGESEAMGALLTLGLSPFKVRDAVLREIAAQTESSESSRGEAASERDLPASSPARHPPGDLLRVIPIAQLQRHNECEITLLSLEAYSDGFVLNGRLRCDGGEDVYPFTAPDFRVSDDRGGTYIQGAGGPALQHFDRWRFSYLFTPPFDPLARQLSMAVDDLAWLSYDEVHSRRIVGRVAHGPWSFTIPLADG
jgi:Clp amino terminal domain, pathogenicity island component